MSGHEAYVWAAIVGLVVVVFVTRNVFVVLPARWHPRGAFERALRQAPLAALVALTVPSAGALLFEPGWDLAALWRDARLPAAAVTVAVSWAARSPFPGLAAGVATLFAIGGT
jgi:branched-subunit amino acid transport protein